LENIRWVRSHVPQAARRLAEKGERFSKIVLNPPRSGAKGLEDDVAALAADKILYVSCNPATLARDLAALSSKGYRAARIRPVDLFPHTFHVETLAEIVMESPLGI
jgi:23S rRNA (uracil1939-C5)-methyltransferase